ncbi:TFIID-31kDa-domain-containing protein [Cryphonectria parasitica EP155]|uniref:TFIID-31kDa-domain-containing protein n=1 Tax=Cryphonectria parasitica (strain ATCC 38755 / EP155) TaxID=660469 RepID=A0A9P4Y1E2_CRYP1|nr:TFIID-31kDa-domain-containing protein [Cryphonectria parasitica EP155]KAF3764729.1 TFIID-31kDa-domain-containing protein [Cryphonectria parasitica EP155]
MSAAAPPQTNGVPSSPGVSQSQTPNNIQSQPTQPASDGNTQPATNGVPSQSTQSQPQPQASSTQQQAPTAAGAQAAGSNTNASSAPKPRDQRTIELLLNAQGVTAFESRVPLLLLDFAYRHTASVLSDSLYLAADPYTTHAGSKPSAASGAASSVPGTGGDATVSANAVRLAIGSRLAYQFHGGGGATGGGGISKDALANLAAERNKVALPRVPANEWGVRLPSERFVMTGMGWGLRDILARGDDDSEDNEDDDDDQEMVDAMEVQPNEEDVGGDGVEGGTMEDVFGAENNEQVGEEDVDMGGAD